MYRQLSTLERDRAREKNEEKTVQTADASKSTPKSRHSKMAKWDEHFRFMQEDGQEKVKQADIACFGHFRLPSGVQHPHCCSTTAGN